MVDYKKVPPDVYYSVKGSLQRDYIQSRYPSYHESMLDSFEIVSIDGKISVYYYKDGTLKIEGEQSNPSYRRIIKRVNGLISKKDYI
ncbi:MAG: hypothetical protein ABI340_00570 [Nitrososphaera sp.]|jgi:hypothetical protein